MPGIKPIYATGLRTQKIFRFLNNIERIIFYYRKTPYLVSGTTLFLLKGSNRYKLSKKFLENV